MIYLDTHMIVWLYTGQIKKLSHDVRKLINENEIYISPVVLLELSYLFEIQRVNVKAEEMVADLSKRIGLKVCGKSFLDIILQAMKISWTRDPFDRIIVGNAALDNNILVTKDQTIRDNFEMAVWEIQEKT